MIKKTNSSGTDKIYQMITDKILALLDAGVAPWQKTWKSTGGVGSGPVNIRGTAYRGINPFLLHATAIQNGYTSNVWLTFNQAKKAGGRVTKGQKATPVVFWKFLKVDEKVDGVKTGDQKRIPLLRYFSVFNLDQTEGVKIPKKFQVEADAEPSANSPIDAAEDILSLIDAEIALGGDRAFYSPSEDRIQVPTKEAHTSADAYYRTVFHEVGHWTGHVSRLDRGLGGKEAHAPFGSEQYGREELVAEFTSAFLSAEAGIEGGIENSAAYLANWKKAIKADPKALIWAAGRAQKASDFVLGITWEKDEKKTEEVAA